MRYRTTWHGTIVSSDGRRKPVYNMIDYIVIHEQCKPLVIKARSYSSAENFSDHRLVIADMELTGLFKIHQTRSKAGYNAPIAPANLENIQIAMPIKAAWGAKSVEMTE